MSDLTVPSGLTSGQIALKRSFDLLAAGFALLLLCWLVLLAWIAATISTGNNGFFTQRRIGKGGVPFRVIKLRTMSGAGSDASTHVTTARDPRITRVGRILRATKLDELPQLVNVVLGQMSLVGPRPDVPGFADQLRGEDRVILSIRPGITGPATLAFRDEELLLAEQADPEAYNRDVIFPEKVRLNRDYIENYRFSTDLTCLIRTVFPG